MRDGETATARRPRRTRRHGIALACLALFAFAQLGGVLHHLVVEHVRCAEHGEELHAAGAEHGAVAHAPGDDGARWIGGAAGGDEHDVCALPIGLAAGSAIPARVAVAIEAPIGLAAIPRARAAPPSVAGRRLLALAPKTSPPA